MDGHGAMGKPVLRSGRNLFLRLGGRLSRPGWRLQLRGPGRWSIDLRDRGRGAGAKHDIKHAAPNWIFVTLGGRRRWWWCWCAWLRHGRVLGQVPSIVPLGGQGSPPRGKSTLLRSAGALLSTHPRGQGITRDNESLIACNRGRLAGIPDIPPPPPARAAIRIRRKTPFAAGR